MKQIGLFLQNAFEWLIIVGTVFGGVLVILKLCHFMYEVFAGVYHLLDKLIDKL